MYKHLFFDLDHTLWDFDRNSTETLQEIYTTFRLVDCGVASVDDFSRHFLQVNRFLWTEFDKNRMTHADIRKCRFKMVFDALSLSDHSICDDLNESYLSLLPRKAHLIESAMEVLDHLQGRYHLHIITNGFDEIQALKMTSSGITDYFEHIITNQKANAKKPDPLIFEFALNATQASVSESLMIGDNYEADVLGAIRAGMDVVYYNPGQLPVEAEQPTYDIRHLKEMIAIL